jgi:hypothetical protein
MDSAIGCSVADALNETTASESLPDQTGPGRRLRLVVVNPLVTLRSLRLHAYEYLLCMQVVKDVDLPMGTVFVVQSIVFGIGLLGITYGVTSASWDPARRGSALGWNEFRANLAAIMGQMGNK